MRIPFEIWASPEPTVARTGADSFRDQLAETGHERRLEDLDLLASLGVTASRYPVLWEKTAPRNPDELDLRWARPRLERLAELGIEPVVTLLHHGSGPPYTNLLDPAFPELLARYAGAVARAFPWIRRWTPINEPLTTARFSTLYGAWYPNLRDDDRGFGRALVHEALGMLLAMEAIRASVPAAEFVITEDLQSFTARDETVEAFVAHKRRRMYLSIELVMGRVRPGHEMHAYLTGPCGIAPAELERIAALARPPDLAATAVARGARAAGLAVRHQRGPHRRRRTRTRRVAARALRGPLDARSRRFARTYARRVGGLRHGRLGVALAGTRGLRGGRNLHVRGSGRHATGNGRRPCGARVVRPGRAAPDPEARAPEARARRRYVRILNGVASRRLGGLDPRAFGGKCARRGAGHQRAAPAVHLREFRAQ